MCSPCSCPKIRDSYAKFMAVSLTWGSVLLVGALLFEQASPSAAGATPSKSLVGILVCEPPAKGLSFKPGTLPSTAIAHISRVKQKLAF